MVSHYCIVTLKASSRRTRFDIVFVKSRPGPFVVPFNVSFGGGVHMCLWMCACVFIKEAEAQAISIHTIDLFSASQPSHLGRSSLDLQSLTSMLGDCCHSSPSQCKWHTHVHALLMHHILYRQEESVGKFVKASGVKFNANRILVSVFKTRTHTHKVRMSTHKISIVFVVSTSSGG